MRRLLANAVNLKISERIYLFNTGRSSEVLTHWIASVAFQRGELVVFFILTGLSPDRKFLERGLFIWSLTCGGCWVFKASSDVQKDSMIITSLLMVD